MTCRFCDRHGRHMFEKICEDCRSEGKTKADFKLKPQHTDFPDEGYARRTFYELKGMPGIFAVQLKKRFIYRIENNVLYRGRLLRLNYWVRQ